MLYNWNDYSTLKFLSEYKDHPCLWNPCHENYHNEAKKIEALNRIIKNLKLNTLTVDACLQQIGHIRKTYHKEQEKEIRDLRRNKPYRSLVPWYDLFKGMVLEIIGGQHIKPIKSVVCIPPDVFTKLKHCPNRNLTISDRKQEKPRPTSCSAKKSKDKNAKQSYRLYPVKRKAQPVVNQDINFYCVHPLSTVFECNDSTVKCQAEKDSVNSETESLSENQGNQNKEHRAVDTPATCSSQQVENLCPNKSDTNLTMFPSKYNNYNYKTNLDTNYDSFSNYSSQYKPMAAGNSDKYSKYQSTASTKFTADALHRKKSYSEILPSCTQCADLKKNIYPDTKYVPCTNWNKLYDKEWYSTRYPEKDTTYSTYKDNPRRGDNYFTKYRNFTDDTSLKYRRTLDSRDVYEPHSMLPNKYKAETYDCKVLEARPPLKIIIMGDDKTNSACQEIQIEAKGQEKAVCTSKTVLCNKEIQCCDSKNCNETTDIGITCCRDNEVLPTVRVSSFTVGNKYQCQKLKETELHCCTDCKMDGSEKDVDTRDGPMQDLTIKLIMDCMEKVLKSQEREMFKQCPMMHQSSSSNTEKSISDCDNGKEENDRGDYSNHVSLYTQTSNGLLPTVFNDDCLECNEISKTTSSRNFGIQTSPELKDNCTQMEQEECKIRYLSRIVNDFKCSDDCKRNETEDPTKVDIEDCDLFHTLFSINRKNRKKMKEKERSLNFEKATEGESCSNDCTSCCLFEDCENKISRKKCLN